MTITNHRAPIVGDMAGHLSDSEKQRIEEFVNTPKYDREPEQLLPDEE